MFPKLLQVRPGPPKVNYSKLLEEDFRRPHTFPVAQVLMVLKTKSICCEQTKMLIRLNMLIMDSNLPAANDLFQRADRYVIAELFK